MARARRRRRDVGDIVNQREIRIVGMRRSGNHAITNWIRRQVRGEQIWYLNDVAPNVEPFRYHYEYVKDLYPEYLNRAHSCLQESHGRLTPKDALILSYEDWPLPAMKGRRYERRHSIDIGRSQQRYDVLVLRDPFNLLASRLQKGIRCCKKRSWSFSRLWLAYAREFLGETNYLAQRFVPISYNDWFKDETYRAECAALLDLEGTDGGIEEVAGTGGGSSFSSREYNGRAQEMDVLNRWTVFRNDPEYLKAIRNPTLIEYAERIFGPMEAVEELAG
jgi:hypothetical protein